jgi:hypothetical protein
MRIREVLPQTEDLLEADSSLKKQYENYRYSLMNSQSRLQSALEFYRESSEVDEDGNPKGDVESARLQMEIASAEIENARRGLSETQRRLDEIAIKKQETLQILEEYTIVESQNLTKLQSLQGKRFEGNITEFLNDLIVRMNATEITKVKLMQSMGINSSAKTYSNNLPGSPSMSSGNQNAAEKSNSETQLRMVHINQQKLKYMAIRRELETAKLLDGKQRLSREQQLSVLMSESDQNCGIRKPRTLDAIISDMKEDIRLNWMNSFNADQWKAVLTEKMYDERMELYRTGLAYEIGEEAANSLTREELEEMSRLRNLAFLRDRKLDESKLKEISQELKSENHRRNLGESAQELWKSGLESINEKLSNYREGLLTRGIPEGKWMEDTLLEQRAKMIDKLNVDLDIFNGDGSHTSNAALEISDYTAFYDQLSVEFKKYCESRNGTIFTPLSSTYQSYHHQNLDGRDVFVFDHPFNFAKRAVITQGSAFPDGPQGTCGCCAGGSIMNKACYSYFERDVVSYALERELCSDDGGTSSLDRKNIIQGMTGIGVNSMRIDKLEEVALSVESGHGVIIAVSACTYSPEIYGDYVPGIPDGHALVLDSVVRDPITNEIIKYVVIDSNGRNPNEACRLVDPQVLQDAFEMNGCRVNITESVIW